jgi:hypothetical protein
MDPLSDVTIYIYADIALERQHPNLGLKNMNNEVAKWTL